MLKLGEKSIKSLYLKNKTINKAYVNGKLIFNKTNYYCEIEYIESTGTQFIDTEYKPNQNTKVEIFIYNPTDFNTTQVGSILFGSRQGSDNYPTYTVISNILNKYGTRWDYGSKIIETLDQPLTVGKHIIIKDKQYNYLDGNLITTNEPETFSLNYPMHILGTNTNGKNTLPFAGKIYYCKIWDNDTLIRDFIPVLDFDMQPCLYDKVSGKLFYNQGTGSFLCGRQIHEVEYLESDGNQYIDTEYSINTETDEVELNYQLLDRTVYKWLFGEHDNNARFALGAGDGIDKRNLAYGTNTIKLSDTYFFNNKHNFKANKDGVFVDEIKFADYKSFISTSSIWLFSLNLSPYTYGSKTKIWGYKHKRNGNLIRNYIPAVDENGKGFMFDRATHSIFDNAGTGEFLCDKKYTELEYIESTGEQWIDTGIYLTNDYSVEIDFELTEAMQSRAGIYGGLNSSMSRHGALLSPTTNQLEGGYGLSNPYYQLGLPSTARHKIKQEKNKLYYDGNLVHTFDDAIFEINKSASLMNFDFTNYKPAKAIYYSSKWWYKDTLVRDYIPALDLKNTPCMYDRVTKQFFYNKGTGQFLYSKV